MWAGHVVRWNNIVSQRRYLEAVLEENGQWGDHEIDGKMPFRGMQPTGSVSL
jgi:hypothetical protein